MSTPAPSPAPPSTGPVPFDPRNFWAWVAYQFFYRVGWQFKMEATLVAGLISYLTPDPRAIGLFTMVNTLGRQASPILAAPKVDRSAYKRRILLAYWGAAVACWTALTVFLWLPQAGASTRTLLVFGVCYTLFFVFLGGSSVAQGALLGKIIPATMRGRAMAMGVGLSGAVNVGAILAIYWVIRVGRLGPPRNYALAFSLTVACFLCAALALLAVREWPSPPQDRPAGLGEGLTHLMRMTRQSANLRTLMGVHLAFAIGGSILQFYTGYWRRGYAAGAFPENAIIVATVVQVFWQSLSSAILGRVADARGNRGVICALLWVEASIPLAALALGSLPSVRGTWAYLLVYSLVGIRFPMFQLLVNYLLEVVPLPDHALALGAVNTIQLATAPAPLIFGQVAQGFGYPAALGLSALVLTAGAVLGLRLEEPRQAAEEVAPPSNGP